MKVLIRAREIALTKALRAHVEHRIGFALSRFGEHINRVVVELANAEETQNGLEKRCLITVGLNRRVEAQDIHADIFTAVAHAADRAARAVARAIEREYVRPETKRLVPNAKTPRKPMPPKRKTKPKARKG
jgi:ribosomal subunit interface protein